MVEQLTKNPIPTFWKPSDSNYRLPAAFDYNVHPNLNDVTIIEEDYVRYVFSSISDLIGKSEIHLVRISPEDTDNLSLIDKSDSDITTTKAKFKLAGEELGHFAGFLEERWRRNDYVWARLDTAEILLKTLWQTVGLENTEPIAGNTQKEWLQKIQSEIRAEEKRAHEYPPHQSTHEEIGFGKETLKNLSLETRIDDSRYLMITLIELLETATGSHLRVAKMAVRFCVWLRGIFKHS